MSATIRSHFPKVAFLIRNEVLETKILRAKSFGVI